MMNDLKEIELKEKELNETEMEMVAGGKKPGALDMLKESATKKSQAYKEV